jgi:error-prone DNA polymerase
VTGYAELHCISNYSFLRGASHPEELVRRAHTLGYRALAITDECSVAGLVRAHIAARECGLHLICGSEFLLECGTRVVALVTDRAAWAELCALITKGRRAAEKGRYRLGRADFAAGLGRCLVLVCPGPAVAWAARVFAGRVWLAAELLSGADDATQLETLQRTARRYGLPLVATGDVHMHIRARRVVQDLVTAIRHRCPLAEAGPHLFPSGERHLRAVPRVAARYPAAALAESVRIADRCTFSLDELRYEYPEEVVPAGHTPSAWLRQLTEQGMQRRWPGGVPDRVRRQVEDELSLIAELSYELYFLTVYDIVEFARARGILCQGRGSAANSAVCYCLGITEVDPARMNMLFGRFISRERDEPPDIDVDFEHERREEVIQYIYGRYGRDRAALAATVITYRRRSATRDITRALGREAPPRLVEALIGFPRHLSQHVGGFVIARGLLHELVPIENAAMADRTVIEWDKDDLDTLGLLKVDCLALGMLTAIPVLRPDRAPHGSPLDPQRASRPTTRACMT